MMHAVLLGLLIACNAEPEGSDSGVVLAPTNEAFPMTEGTWVAASFNPQSDDCRLHDPTDPFLYFSASFDLWSQDDASFTIENDENEWTCSLSGNGFMCDPLVEREPLPYDIVGDFVWETQLDGVFLSEGEMSAKPTIILDCEGSGCNQIQPVLELALPCTLSAEVPASAQAE